MRRLAIVAGLSLAVSMGAVACDDDDASDAAAPATTEATTEVGAGAITDGAATTGGADGAAGGEGFTISFEPLNDSGVTGSGTVTPGPNGRLRVAFTADGLVPGQMHLQHIHEPDGQGAAVRCPTPEDDADGDGVVSLEESEAAYGPVRLDLTPYPNAEGGSVRFARSYTVPQRFRPLTDGAVVIHGLEVDGMYDATVPVACGLVTEG